MKEAVQNHKVAVILNAIQTGLSPSQTAEIFRKHAEVINACCDGIIQAEAEGREKAAVIDLSGISNKLLFGPPVLASLGAFAAGRMAGDTAAKVLTPVNEVPVSTYQKADEILRTERETADILARVARKNQEEKEKSKDRSVRSLF